MRTRPIRREQGMIWRVMRRGVRTMEVGRHTRRTKGALTEEDGSKDVEERTE